MSKCSRYFSPISENSVCVKVDKETQQLLVRDLRMIYYLKIYANSLKIKVKR